MGNLTNSLLANQGNDSMGELEIMKKFKSHNVLYERVHLYEDFSINLLNKIFDTYLGKEYIKNMQDIEGHYNWCFGKVLEEFDDQEISFYGNDELYDYFLRYYVDEFYKLEKPPAIRVYTKLWKGIFDYKKLKKPKEEFSVFIELYAIFDKSIEEKHRVLEEN